MRSTARPASPRHISRSPRWHQPPAVPSGHHELAIRAIQLSVAKQSSRPASAVPRSARAKDPAGRHEQHARAPLARRSARSAGVSRRPDVKMCYAESWFPRLAAEHTALQLQSSSEAESSSAPAPASVTCEEQLASTASTIVSSCLAKDSAERRIGLEPPSLSLAILDLPSKGEQPHTAGQVWNNSGQQPRAMVAISSAGAPLVPTRFADGAGQTQQAVSARDRGERVNYEAGRELHEVIPITEAARKAWPSGAARPPLAELAVEPVPWEALDVEGRERERMPRRETPARFIHEEVATDGRREAVRVLLPKGASSHAHPAYGPFSARQVSTRAQPLVSRPSLARPARASAPWQGGVAGQAGDSARREEDSDSAPRQKPPVDRRRRPSTATADSHPMRRLHSNVTDQAQPHSPRLRSALQNSPSSKTRTSSAPDSSACEPAQSPRLGSAIVGPSSAPPPRRPKTTVSTPMIAKTSHAARAKSIGPLPAAALLCPELGTFMTSGHKHLDQQQMLRAYEAAGALTARRRVDVRLNILRVFPDLRNELDVRSVLTRQLKLELLAMMEVNYVAANKAESLRWLERKPEIEEERIAKRQQRETRFQELRKVQLARRRRKVVTLEQKNEFRQKRRMVDLTLAMRRFRKYVEQRRIASLQTIYVHGVVATHLGQLLHLGRKIQEMRSTSRYTRAARVVMRSTRRFLTRKREARLDKLAGLLQRTSRMFLWRRYVVRRRFAADLLARQLTAWSSVSVWRLVLVRFLARVRLVQRYVRHLIFMRQVALNLLCRQWDKAESRYLCEEYRALSARQNQAAIRMTAMQSARIAVGRKASVTDGLHEEEIPEADANTQSTFVAQHVPRDVKLSKLMDLRSIMLKEHLRARADWEKTVLERVLSHPLHKRNWPEVISSRLRSVDPATALSAIGCATYKHACILSEPLEPSPQRLKSEAFRRVQLLTQMRIAELLGRDRGDGQPKLLSIDDPIEDLDASTDQPNDKDDDGIATQDMEHEGSCIQTVSGSDLVHNIVKWCPAPRRQYAASSYQIESLYERTRDECEFQHRWETRAVVTYASDSLREGGQRR